MKVRGSQVGSSAQRACIFLRLCWWRARATSKIRATAISLLLLALAVGLAGPADAAAPGAAEPSAGDRVEVNWGLDWVPGEVVEVTSSGWIKVKITVRGGHEITPTLPRDHIRLPAGAVQPAPRAAETPDMRTWTDSTGTYTTKGALLVFKDGQVTLRKKDGSTVTLPLEKLSPEDQDYVKSLGKKPPEAIAEKAVAPATEMERLLAKLKSSDYFTRESAIEGLARLKTEEAAEAIAERLGVFGDRMAASEALQRMGPVAESAVLKQLDHEDWSVRQEACEILGKIGTQKSVPVLKQALNDSNGIVQHYALEALRRLGASEATPGGPEMPRFPMPSTAPQATPGGPEMPHLDMPAFGGEAIRDEDLVLLSVLCVAIAIPMWAGWWAVFAKAGRPGWLALIPIGNLMVLLDVAGRPLWWVLLLLFVPVGNSIILIIVGIDIAQRFGKGIGFGVCLGVLPFIFYPILGFGSAQYGPVSYSSSF
jgi:hypothetical protein